ncbi:hypothetical protein ABE61_08210 [Lysinibacillus sphaericus]|uniref:MFS transporter n=1 Tax=Lysinibacillus sphaericus TaxID=1421 RepID=UPI0018CED5BD|nr:MFS transporter [Lysinibacillus sphaericus]MBG9454051.1 hypothetical protein [Lysinibacillus sphaericus]MBG9479357.1 hypothetical protein [Lysinibacillus sphaericus]MBG9593445.1 hypothetical protein [Lysinibacillus sphaericus]
MEKLKFLLAANLVSTVGIGISGYLIIWLLIDQLNQAVIYGYLSIFIMLFIVLITPYIGNLVDGYSRKKIFFYLEVIGAIVLIIFMIFYSLDLLLLKIILLSVLIIYLNLYDSIKYPTLAALSQEIFKESEYNKVNSSLEVQGQTALMISSALAALIIGSVSFNLVLIINIITFIISAVLISFIPYQEKVNVETAILDRRRQEKPIKEFVLGIKYLSTKPFFLTLVLFVSISPNIAVIVMNYLEPIFIYQFLNKGPEVLGIANILYAVGAILGGIISIWVAKKLSTVKALFLFLFLFSLGSIVIYIYPNVTIFLIASILWGFSNSSSRIFRKDYMFNNIENEYMGRITVTFDSIKLLLQALTIFIITTFFVSQNKVIYGYLTLALLTLVSSLLLFTYKSRSNNKG